MRIIADNGHTLWRVEHRQGNKINANSPVYTDSRVFCASDRADTLTGHLMILLSDEGNIAEVGWRNEERFNLLGGIILHEGSLYSSTYNKKEWYCLDAESGNLNYVSDKVSGGATIFADGLFYCYGTDGVLALVEEDATDCNVIDSFEVPVIHDGRLYVRHGDALMCYEGESNSGEVGNIQIF